MIGFFKAHESTMVTPTLYGITGFALILFSWALLRDALIFHSRDRTRITPENVRAAVRDWLDKFHFGVQVIAPEDGALFRFASTSAAGTNVAIIQAKNNPQYLFLKSSLVLTEQEQRQIAELPNHGEAAVIRQLRMTLASFKISYSGIGAPLREAGVFRPIPITEDLKEHDLIQALDEIELAMSLIKEILRAPLESVRQIS